jgi:hypothetical protein
MYHLSIIQYKKTYEEIPFIKGTHKSVNRQYKQNLRSYSVQYFAELLLSQRRKIKREELGLLEAPIGALWQKQGRDRAFTLAKLAPEF